MLKEECVFLMQISMHQRVCASGFNVSTSFHKKKQINKHPQLFYSQCSSSIDTSSSCFFSVPVWPSWETGCVKRCWWRGTAAETRPRSFTRNGWSIRLSWPNWPRIRNGWIKLKRWVLPRPLALSLLAVHLSVRPVCVKTMFLELLCDCPKLMLLRPRICLDCNPGINRHKFDLNV